jgi:hypothetical protein
MNVLSHPEFHGALRWRNAPAENQNAGGFPPASQI